MVYITGNHYGFWALYFVRYTKYHWRTQDPLVDVRFSSGPSKIGISPVPHLRTEAGQVSETLCSLVFPFRIPEDEWDPLKPINSNMKAHYPKACHNIWFHCTNIMLRTAHRLGCAWYKQHFGNWIWFHHRTLKGLHSVGTVGKGSSLLVVSDVYVNIEQHLWQRERFLQLLVVTAIIDKPL
jgi:hypothetical protein